MRFDLGTVEDADDRVLAEDARHDREAEVDLPAVHAQLESAVLRQPALADVELGHHLQSRNELFSDAAAVDAAHVLHHAVETQADAQAACRAFQVDVARTFLQRVVERRVEQAHHRAGLLAELQRGELEGGRSGLDRAESIVEVGQRPIARSAFAEQCVDAGRRRGDPADVASRTGLDALQQQRVDRPVGDDRQRPGRGAREHRAPSLRVGGRPQLEIELPGRIVRWRQAARQHRGEVQGLAVTLVGAQVLFGDRGGERHCTCSTSWKIGRYMRTITAPMTTPMTSISAGLTMRVTNSVRWTISSS